MGKTKVNSNHFGKECVRTYIINNIYLMYVKWRMKSRSLGEVWLKCLSRLIITLIHSMIGVGNPSIGQDTRTSSPNNYVRWDSIRYKNKCSHCIEAWIFNFPPVHIDHPTDQPTDGHEDSKGSHIFNFSKTGEQGFGTGSGFEISVCPDPVVVLGSRIRIRSLGTPVCGKFSKAITWTKRNFKNMSKHCQNEKGISLLLNIVIE